MGLGCSAGRGFTPECESSALAFNHSLPCRLVRNFHCKHHTLPYYLHEPSCFWGGYNINFLVT